MSLRIGEVADRTGIAASAIRYHEREGLIPKADRRGNARVYGPDILDRLALIELAKSAGFKVAETRNLVRGIRAGRALAPAGARSLKRNGSMPRISRAANCPMCPTPQTASRCSTRVRTR